MRIYSIDKNHITVENNAEGYGEFSLNIHSSHFLDNVGFQLVFPEDCEIIEISKNSIIINRKRRKEDNS